jgi:hypothetical protein
MKKRTFGKTSGSSHFSELQQQDLANFKQNTFFIEVDSSVDLADLTDPQRWGPQKMLRRGDFVNVLRADDAFFATLICLGSTAGYPRFHIVTKMEIAPALAEAAGHIEEKIGGWSAIVGNSEIAAGLASEAEAKAALTQALERSN